jgi:hypothetical protein
MFRILITSSSDCYPGSPSSSRGAFKVSILYLKKKKIKKKAKEQRWKNKLDSLFLLSYQIKMLTNNIFPLPSKYSNRQLSHPMLTNCHVSKSNKFSPASLNKNISFLFKKSKQDFSLEMYRWSTRALGCYSVHSFFFLPGYSRACSYYSTKRKKERDRQARQLYIRGRN